MKRLKTSKHVLLASLVVCTALASVLLMARQIVLAAATPIPGVGVAIRKNPSGKASNARTNQDGTFTIENLETGSYTMSMKVIEDYPSPRKFKTAVITIKGVKGGTLIKRVPLTELRTGVTVEIEIVGKGIGSGALAALKGTCMATDDER